MKLKTTWMTVTEMVVIQWHICHYAQLVRNWHSNHVVWIKQGSNAQTLCCIKCLQAQSALLNLTSLSTLNQYSPTSQTKLLLHLDTFAYSFPVPLP